MNADSETPPPILVRVWARNAMLTVEIPAEKFTELTDWLLANKIVTKEEPK